MSDGNDFIDRDSHSGWIRFFFIFSRFEYALKRCSKYRKGNERTVEADWYRFSEDIKLRIDLTNIDEAKEYLLSNPPQKQVLKNADIFWEDMNGLNDDIRSLINIVKQVRNNLFHGGKYHGRSIKDPSRDNELIKHSITVLKYLLCLSPEVKEHYFAPLE